MIFVPDSNYTYYFTNSDYSIIYATNDSLDLDHNISVRKYYTKSHYDFIDSSLVYSNEYDTIDNSRITDNWFYRQDSLDICFLVFLGCLFFYFIPLKIWSRLFKRGGL